MDSELGAPLVSKVGVSAGDSLLEDMEGCGDELMLRRACAAGGGGPKLRVEIIRSTRRGAVNDVRLEQRALDVEGGALGVEVEVEEVEEVEEHRRGGEAKEESR